MASPAGKTFRIFVSSTFSDLKEERNALQERVFPRLRELCAGHGFRFQAIDLRWGVSEEAALDQQTVRICLEEIARCQRTALKPNFIVLLGDRYGWCPLPYEIPASEYEEIERRIDDPSSHRLLADWYRRDDNAVPPAYCLQRRTGEFIDPGVWEERVERPLRSALLEAVDGMDLSEDDRLKYGSSATEQEIVHGALKVADAGEHVFCFFRSFLVEQADGSVAVQRENGTLSPVDDVLAEGEFHHFVERAPHGGFDPGAYAQLGNLKGRLETLLPGKTMKYEARWTDSGVTLSHLDALCADVFASLSREIMKQISRFEKADPLEDENRAHEEFGEDRAKGFIGRAAILATIRTHIKSGSRHPLAIHGAPGSGKSALMARAVQESREGLPNVEVIVRFIGATPASSDGRSLLEDLCRQIYKVFDLEGQKKQRVAEIEGEDKDAQDRRLAIEREYAIPSDFQGLSGTLQRFVGRGPADAKLILFLDAVDQLSNTDLARSLSWLPAELPGNVCLVVSTLPGECQEALERKLPPGHLLNLEPMPPKEGAGLLDRWLSDAHRTLMEVQWAEVLGKFRRCGMPLYLKLAFEEARRWRSYDGLPTGPDNRPGLSEDVSGIIGDLFWRLSREENHGGVMVSHGLGYIAAGKNGVTEDELLDILSRDGEVIEDFRRRSTKSPPMATLPIVVWSRLHSDMEPYLTERRGDGTSLLSFYHRQFGEAVVQQHLDSDLKTERHSRLADYYGSQPLRLEMADTKVPNLRKLSELPYQQAHGGMAERFRKTLLDFEFMYAKVCAVGPHPLIADYDLASLPQLSRRDAMSDFPPGVLVLLQGALRLSKNALAGNPDRLAGQLIGRMISDDSLEIKTLLSGIADGVRIPWLRPLNASLYSPGRQFLGLLEHGGRVCAVAITPDGRYVVSVSGRTMKVWDLASETLVRTLEGHSDSVYAVAITLDGRHAVSGSDDKTLKVWDLENGALVHTLEGHSRSVKAVAITPDGRHAVSGSDDKTLKVWDLGSGALVHTLEGHSDSVKAVAITPDGRHVISCSWQQGLILWDLGSGALVRTLGGHDEWVRAMAITLDGRHAVSWSHYGPLKVWDLENGALVRTLEGHSESVNAVAITPDGRHAVSGSDDKTLKVWDLENGALVRTLGGHSGSVNAVAITPDGRHVISGSDDKTVKVWDMESEAVVRSLEGHSSFFYTVAVTPDGSHAVSLSLRNLKVWDLGSGVLVHTLEQGLVVGGVYAMAITPDSRHAVSWSGCSTLQMWDLGSGALVRTLGIPSIDGISWVSVVAVTPDGRHAVSGSYEGTLKVWDLENWALVHTLDHGKSVNAVAITPDGRHWVSGSDDDTTLKVWDLESGELVHTLEDFSGCGNAMAITPDGRHAVSGSYEGTLKVWDLESGALVRTLGGHSGSVNAVAITPDGLHAVSWSRSTLKVWDLESGALVHILGGHSERVRAVAITPDGRHVVSGSDDWTLKVWDLESGRIVTDYYGDSDFESCAVEKEGAIIVAGEKSGGVHILRMENLIPGPLITTVFAIPDDDCAAFGCPLCRVWSPVPHSALGTEIPCPNCGKVVKLNPFTINADWLVIEKAWRGTGPSSKKDPGH